jgi:hypothetical protein
MTLMPDPAAAARSRAERALDVLNVVLADVRYGLGPYGIVYLMTRHGWDEASLRWPSPSAASRGW